MCMVSVIMPVYNSKKYLREAVESVICQTYQDWEFIIINEYGSNDGSAEMIKNYAAMDERFIFIQNEEQLGISESMNRGLCAARGKYIARMNADDISLPERFQKQVACMEQDPEIVMCGVKAEIFGSHSFTWELETDSGRLSTNILFYSPCIHPTVMIRKSFLEQYKIKYNKKYRASEDYDLFSKICRHGSIVNLDETLFRYRMMDHNATFKNNQAGRCIYREVMKRQFRMIGLSLSESDLKLLSPHDSIKGLSGKAVYYAIEKAEILLQKILIANAKANIYERQNLWMTLRKRFFEICESAQWFCSNYDHAQVEKLKRYSVFSKKTFYKSNPEYKRTKPLISVVMPVYNSTAYILGAVWSVLDQTYQNLELLIINEAGSEDDLSFFTSLFEDKRIRVIQNNVKLGLAESLNRGIREAKGKYIARMDADDLCAPQRFELQVKFLEKNPEYGICGSWQRHFGMGVDWVHKCSVSYEDIQAELLFNCDLCHSTLMLRRSSFLKHHLFYDASYAAEDYELWTRAAKVMKIANLPRILGEYRVGNTNITTKKMKQLSEESGELVAKNIEYYFGLKLPKHLIALQSGWNNEFEKLTLSDRKKALKEQALLFQKIWKCNQKYHKLNTQSLLKTLNKRWRCITNTWEEDGEIFGLNELFDRYRYGCSNHKFRRKYKKETSLVKNTIKNILKRPYYAWKRRTLDILQKNIWDVDGHIGDYYQKLLLELYSYNKEIKEQKVFLKKELHKKIEYIVEEVKEQLWEVQTCINNLAREEIWKAEQHANEILDTRIWKAEQCVNERIDARIWKAEQCVNERTEARIWKAEQHIVELQMLLAKLMTDFLVPDKKIILVNTPCTHNLGDHAIAYAEKCWIKDRLPYHFIELNGDFYRKYRTVIKEFIREDDRIALSGGGYIGTLWPYEEELVEQVIVDYPENKIYIFPQTIFFSKNEQAFVKAKEIFEKHKNLILFVREHLSYEFAKMHMPKCKTILASDMVLYFLMEEKYPLQEYVDKNGIGFCLKNDKESVICADVQERMKQEIRQLGKKVMITDTMLEENIDVSMRYDEVRKKILEFQTYEIVITDRFHGIIFSILAGTKCIVLEGLSYKNKGFCQMLAGTNSVVFAQPEEISLLVSDPAFLQAEIKLDQVKKMIEKQFSEMETYF